ncbi:hypothetical protein BDD12DRAFT_21287 [Trichophaea hybrida]|nr:hypothetical protein BDD12DRAFT_21287 [Trichophaea hybrida]
MITLTELKHIFSGVDSTGDRRWSSNSPLRPLRGIITLSLLLIIIQSSGWISYEVAAAPYYGSFIDLISLIFILIGFMFIFSASLDIVLYFRHHLRPVYAVSIASIWSAGWLSSTGITGLLAWWYLQPWAFSPGDPEISPGVGILEVLISAGMLGLYVWYLVLAVKVFRQEKKMKRESISLPDLIKFDLVRGGVEGGKVLTQHAVSLVSLLSITANKPCFPHYYLLCYS